MLSVNLAPISKLPLDEMVFTIRVLPISGMHLRPEIRTLRVLENGATYFERKEPSAYHLTSPTHYLDLKSLLSDPLIGTCKWLPIAELPPEEYTKYYFLAKNADFDEPDNFCLVTCSHLDTDPGDVKLSRSHWLGEDRSEPTHYLNVRIHRSI